MSSIFQCTLCLLWKEVERGVGYFYAENCYVFSRKCMKCEKFVKTSEREPVGDEKRNREGVLRRLVVLAPPKLEK